MRRGKHPVGVCNLAVPAGQVPRSTLTLIDDYLQSVLFFTPDETKEQIRARALAYIGNPANVATLLAEYEAVHRNLLDSDRVTQLLLSDTEDQSARTVAVAAVYPAAKRLVNEIFLRKLDAGVRGGLFGFTGGGPASGKSVLLATMRERMDIADFREFLEAEVLFDGTLSDSQRAKQHIGLALQRGKRVRVLVVFQPFQQAVEGAIRRAVQTGGERPLRMDVVAAGHFNAWQTARELARAFAGADFALKVQRFAGLGQPFVEETIDVIEQAAAQTTLAEMEQLAYELLESQREHLLPSLYEAMRKPVC